MINLTVQGGKKSKIYPYYKILPSLAVDSILNISHDSKAAAFYWKKLQAFTLNKIFFIFYLAAMAA